MPNSQAPTPHALETGIWTLEVVRGATLGYCYPLVGAEVVVGNGRSRSDGVAFVGLADQEGASPRKMAAQHATLTRSGGDGWSIRDLDTPGGTFVNNRRVVPGSSLALNPGDVIQLGAVQVRLNRAASAAPAPAPVPPTPPAPGPAATFRYQSSTSGTTCRTWDDFLTFSAQRWDELRDDLTAGRLTEFVRSVGRPDLAPAESRGTPNAEQADTRLDAWLALLPTRTPAAPELDVHPLRVTIPAPGGGVTIPRKIRVANVGYRLLRARVTIEQASGATFAVGPTFSNREVVVRDSVDVGFEVTLPDPFAGTATAQVVIRSEGGVEQRVHVEVVRKDAATSAAPSGDSTVPTAAIPGPVAAFLGFSLGKRVAIASLVGLAARLLVGVAGGAIGEDAMIAAGPDTPGLGGVVVAFGLVAAALVGGLMARRGGWRDGGSGLVAGAGLGALVGSATVALCRSIEPALGSMAASPLPVFGLWAAIGAGLALLTPSVPTKPEEPAR